MFLPIGYYNNDFLPIQDIKLSVLDLSIQRGYGVFDFFKLVDLKNPWSDWYFDRLSKSCSLSGLSLPEDRTVILEKAKKLLNQNGLTSGYIKILVTGGPSHNGFIPSDAPSLIMIGLPLNIRNENHYKKGVSLLTCNYQRDIPQIKSINYLNSLRFLREGNVEYVDLLYYRNGEITETSRCNVFIVKNQELFTPALNILEGITRKRVLKHSSIKIHVGPVSLQSAIDADEVFITSTTKGAMPVTRIDENVIGDGKVGKVSMKISNLIDQF